MKCIPSSNIAPWWRRSNLSTATMRADHHVGSVSSRKAYLEQINCIREPIISVQQQRQARDELPRSINCKSNYTDRCYAEYNLYSLRRGFGQLKDVRNERSEPNKPSLVVHSATLDRNETDIFDSTNEVLKEMNRLESRKRFAIVHTEKYIYVIGGYLFDHRIPSRTKPLHDYKYDLQQRQSIPTEPLPNGAIGFGLCADNDCIYVVGGSDLNNQPLTECYCLLAANSNERWIRLPDLPAPTSGAGVAVCNGELHCIGGYDVLGNEFLAHGEYLILHFGQDEQWQYGPEIDNVRARPLVFIIPGDDKASERVYVVGGFNIDRHTHKPYLIPDLLLLNQTTRRWQRVTTIPDLQLMHELSFNKNKLYVRERSEQPNQATETNLLRSFDLGQLIWTTGGDNDDNKRADVQSSSPVLTSAAERTKESTSNRNVQRDETALPTKTKLSSLKSSNSGTQQNRIKSDHGAVSNTKAREINRVKDMTRMKIPTNTKLQASKQVPKGTASNAQHIDKRVNTKTTR